MVDKVILVTGGTGFIGQELIKTLLRRNFKVRCLTRRPSEYKGSALLSFVKGDILNPESLEKHINGCYGLVHIAGEKIDKSKMELTNVHGTKNVCEIACKANLNFFCHISSIGVIGLADGKIIDETAKTRPTNTYEKTKLVAENYILKNFNDKSCSSVILRPTNVFGKKHVIFPNTLPAKLKRWIKGNEVANYVYVKDVVASIMFFLESDKVYDNTVFNINDASPKNTFKEIYRLANDKLEFWFNAPIIVPWFLRLLKLGKNNMGNKVYSINKLVDEGYEHPFGLEKAINDLLGGSPELWSPKTIFWFGLFLGFG